MGGRSAPSPGIPLFQRSPEDVAGVSRGLVEEEIGAGGDELLL